jgi:hypothetical protein
MRTKRLSPAVLLCVGPHPSTRGGLSNWPWARSVEIPRLMGSSGHKPEHPMHELIRQIPRAHKTFRSDLAALEGRSAVLLFFFSRPSTMACVCARLPRNHGLGLVAMVRCRLRKDGLQRMKFTTPRVRGNLVMGMRDRRSSEGYVRLNPHGRNSNNARGAGGGGGGGSRGHAARSRVFAPLID